MIVSLGVLFEVLSIIFCLHYLYGERVRFDKVTVLFAVVYSLWMMLANYHYISDSWTLMIYPIVLLYCGIRFGWKFKAIIINIILYSIIISALQTSIILILQFVIGIAHLNVLAGTIINIIIFVMVITILRQFNLKKLSEILQSKDWLIISALLIVLISILFSLLNYKNIAKFDLVSYLVIVASVILIGFVVIDIGKHKMKAMEAEAELRLHKLYEQSYQSLIEEIRARQHEFDNHINAIHSQHFLYQTYDELVKAQEKYCNQIVKENYYNKMLSEGNPVILSFLYSKFKEAEKREIAVSYRIAIKELDCNVPVHKIVELLGNLLNNAMDALSADEELSKMSVVMTEYDDRIRIEVANECKGIDYNKLDEFFKRGYSEKGKNRGYGLYNVKKICEDYRVDLECSIKKIEEQEWLFFEINMKKLKILKENKI